MAKIIIDGKENEVPDNSALQETCRNNGIPFGCTEGMCATCIVEIEEGKDNLTDITENEIEMELESNERLACQCKIKSGIVKLKKGWED